MRATSVLDVIDNWRIAQGIDDDAPLGRLDQDLLSALVREIDAFYATASPVTDREMIHLIPALWTVRKAPGLASRAVSHTDTTISALGFDDPNQAHLLRRAYAASLVCGDVVYDWDPLTPRIRLVALAGALLSEERRAEIKNLDVDYDPENLPSRSGSTLERWILRQLGPPAARDKAAIDRVYHEVKDMRPLLESGVLVMIPSPFLPHDPAFLELPEQHDFSTMATRTARAQGVSIVPLETDVTCSQPRKNSTGTADVNTKVATSLAIADLPILSGLSAATLAAIHRDEEAFVEWRAALRVAARQIYTLANDDNLEREARSIYEDLLLPRINALKRTVSRTTALRQALRDEPVRAAFGAIFSGGAAVAAGLSPAATLMSASAGAAANIAYAGLHRPGQAGADAVLQLLMRDPKKGQRSDDTTR